MGITRCYQDLIKNLQTILIGFILLFFFLDEKEPISPEADKPKICFHAQFRNAARIFGIPTHGCFVMKLEIKLY